jgi:hypothetical protein
MSIYTDNGFSSRSAYLRNLSEEMEIDIGTVLMAADLLGPNEDFDGLVTELEDYA